MKNILLAVTGSIASYKACDIISLFRKEGYNVKCAMSKDAKWFITPLTLETLTGNKVAVDMFALPDNRTPGHISLADEADLILVAPATADIIARVACGICDDVVSCVICATDKPVVFAPAMNTKMYQNAIVQGNIKKLTDLGYKFVGPVKGRLACGTEGDGHIAEPRAIVDFSIKALRG